MRVSDQMAHGFHMRSGRRAPLLALLLGCMLPAAAPAGDKVALETYASEHYTIHTNLTRDEARMYGRHMDRLFKAYEQRFANLGLRARDTSAMPLYLFRGREQYVRFMNDQVMLNASNSGGMFFFRRDIQGLATFTQDRPLTETLAVLQHEGFHQFAFRYIGTGLPIWVNEGLAQYFEDGIFVKGRLVLDLANGERIESIKAALAENRTISFDVMLSMTDEQWSQTLQSDPRRAALLYDQAWSMVFFLATADRGRYVEPFRNYLKAVADGRDSAAAFREAYRLTETQSFERAWQRWAAQAEPDPVNITLARLNFLGHAVQFLHEHDMPMPKTVQELRNQLQKIRYRAIKVSHDITTEINSMDEAVYRYPIGGKSNRYFDVLAPTRADLPPCLAATGLNPQPMIVWSRDAEGKLIQDVVFR